MANEENASSTDRISRRQFLMASGAALTASSIPAFSVASPGNVIRVNYNNRWNFDAAFSDKYKPLFEQATNKLLQLARSGEYRKIFEAMVMTESGGEHFGQNGKVKMSTFKENQPIPEIEKHAYGRAQVIYKTAVSTAKKWLNEELDWNKFLNDPSYNTEIGYGYFRELLGIYRGNPFLGILAYNGGPGGTNSRVKSYGERIDDTGASLIDFASSIQNDENRRYIIKTLLNLGLVDLNKLGKDFTSGGAAGVFTPKPGNPRGYDNGFDDVYIKYRRRIHIPDGNQNDMISPTNVYRLGDQILSASSPSTVELRGDGKNVLPQRSYQLGDQVLR